VAIASARPKVTTRKIRRLVCLTMAVFIIRTWRRHDKHDCWAGNYMVFIRCLPEASSLFRYSIEILERARQNLFLPPIALRFVCSRRRSIHPTPPLSLLPTSLPTLPPTAPPSIRTYFISYYKADDARCSSGL
jgi:hypothetical protein